MKVVNVAEQEDGGKGFSERGLSETKRVRAADAGDFCEGNAAVTHELAGGRKFTEAVSNHILGD